MIRTGHRWRYALALTLAGFATPLLAANPDSPQWIRKPDAYNLSKHYPVKAQFKSVDGKAVVECHIGKGGFLTDCAVMEESPSNFGFGDAALNVAKTCQLAERTPSGISTIGLKVRIPIRFATSHKQQH